MLYQVSLNSFIEDTCVLIAVAFLLVRGRLEKQLSNPIWAGLLFGVLGASEAIFPNARFPYASNTLACALAIALSGWRGGLLSGIIASMSAIALRPWADSSLMVKEIAIVIAVLVLVPQDAKWRNIWIVVLFVPAQGLAVFVGQQLHSNQISMISPWTMLANPLGCTLLLVVLRDAQLRSQVENNRELAAQAQRVAADAQLAALRSRVHPHFLFNVLNTITALCQLDPKRAARATTLLGELMRHSFEADFSQWHPLSQEIEIVKKYVVIEMERFGSKLSVDYDIDKCLDVLVPEFGIQLLVENAIMHGVSPKMGSGKVQVIARKRRGFVTVAVLDDGVGFPAGSWRREGPQGLEVLERQIELQPGFGRLRLVRRPDGGSMAIVRLASQMAATTPGKPMERLN